MYTIKYQMESKKEYTKKFDYNYKKNYKPKVSKEQIDEKYKKWFEEQVCLIE